MTNAHYTPQHASDNLADAAHPGYSVYYVRNADHRIVNVLAGLAAHFGKTWCKPSQDKILELLRTLHGRVMSRRSLNRHLGSLERDLLVRRIRRHKRGADGRLQLHSTVYVLLPRALQRLAKLIRWFRQFATRPSAPDDQSAVSLVAQNKTRTSYGRNMARQI